MNKLDKYEKDVLGSFENNEWQSVKNLENKKTEYSRYARNTFLKNKRINIRISERDLINLKAKSLEEGIPYQTLIVSILLYINMSPGNWWKQSKPLWNQFYWKKSYVVLLTQNASAVFFVIPNRSRRMTSFCFTAGTNGGIIGRFGNPSGRLFF